MDKDNEFISNDKELALAEEQEEIDHQLVPLEDAGYKTVKELSKTPPGS